jgi:hypothetical protein
VEVTVPGLAAGRYRATCFDTGSGTIVGAIETIVADGQPLAITVPDLRTDLALAIATV